MINDYTLHSAFIIHNLFSHPEIPKIMSKKILYIHGFNSAGGGHKAQELQKMFPNWQVLSPTFDYKDPSGVQKKLDSLVRTQRVNAVMGTSLGGFFAIYCAKKHKLPAMIINPTTRPSETLANHLGKQKNHVTKEEYQFTAADLAKFADFERKVFDKLPCDDTLLHFALSNDDELLGDHHYLEEKFPKCQDFNYFDQQGHRFAGVKILKPILERAMGLSV